MSGRVGMQGTVRARMDIAFRLRFGAAACFVPLAGRRRGVVRRLERQLQLVAQGGVLNLQRSALRFQRRDADRQFINTRHQRRDQRVLLSGGQRRDIGHQTHRRVESRLHPQVNTPPLRAPAKLPNSDGQPSLHTARLPEGGEQLRGRWISSTSGRRCRRSGSRWWSCPCWCCPRTRSARPMRPHSHPPSSTRRGASRRRPGRGCWIPSRAGAAGCTTTPAYIGRLGRNPVSVRPGNRGGMASGGGPPRGHGSDAGLHPSGSVLPEPSLLRTPQANLYQS